MDVKYLFVFLCLGSVGVHTMTVLRWFSSVPVEFRFEVSSNKTRSLVLRSLSEYPSNSEKFRFRWESSTP